MNQAVNIDQYSQLPKAYNWLKTDKRGYSH